MNFHRNVARIKCRMCGLTVIVRLLTEEVDREGRNMGDQVRYDTVGEAVCACGNEIAYGRAEWEYPEGVLNHQEGPHVIGGTLI